MNRVQFETFLMRQLLNAQEHNVAVVNWTGKTILPHIKVQCIVRCTHCKKEEWLAVGSLQDIKSLAVSHTFCETEFVKSRVLEEAIYALVSKRGGGVDNTTCSVFEYSIPEDALSVA